ncbi:hypothetical protein GCM10009116_06130 [Brevundimonas basaltis]|uniref:Uncharacterized protein n=1 Tax=Brevundimonas basaltis TaxID=472166 RepID=A0A7W8I066_9CAUL|nr:putative Ig domain-containing protein [Brevundimonas basaltis]MBB5293156.1 hypothetical protein [Brevundimonas basaltis]
MRTLRRSAVILAGVALASPAGPVSAQAQSPSGASCASAAAKGNRPPAASLQSTASSVGETADRAVTLTVAATDPDRDELTYDYNVTGGRLIGAGSTVRWDLRGVQPRTYTVTVTVDDGRGCSASDSLNVSVDRW